MFIDAYGFVFEKKGRRACYADRVTAMPASYEEATAEQAAAFLLQRAEMWSCVSQYMPMLYKIAHKLNLYDIEQAVHDVGVPCLIRCHKAYDPAYGIKFMTYAYAAVKREFWRYRNKKRLVLEPIDAIAPDQNEEQDVQYILDKLTPYERELLDLHFWDGLNYSQIAEEMCENKGTIRNHVLKALDHCRRIAR